MNVTELIQMVEYDGKQNKKADDMPFIPINTDKVGAKKGPSLWQKGTKVRDPSGLAADLSETFRSPPGSRILSILVL